MSVLAPETLADLAGVDVAGLCSILRLVRDDLVAMLIVEHHNFPIRCISSTALIVSPKQGATLPLLCREVFPRLPAWLLDL